MSECDCTYSHLIETLRKMYVNKKLNINNVKKMLAEKKITCEEYLYVTKE